MDWAELAARLDTQGWAILPGLLAPPACRSLVDAYDDPQRFRTRVIMSRHGFGRGEYQYFAYPLPPLVEQLRATL